MYNGYQYFLLECGSFTRVSRSYFIDFMTFDYNNVNHNTIHKFDYDITYYFDDNNNLVGFKLIKR